MEYELCICGQVASEEHHIVFRSQAPSLVQCSLNKIPLCRRCHASIHHGKGHKLDKLLKLQFQNNLEILWDKHYLSREEMKDVLKISEKQLDRLLKTLPKKDGLYERETVIRKCLGGKMIIEEDLNNESWR